MKRVIENVTRVGTWPSEPCGSEKKWTEGDKKSRGTEGSWKKASPPGVSEEKGSVSGGLRRNEDGEERGRNTEFYL